MYFYSTLLYIYGLLAQFTDLLCNLPLSLPKVLINDKEIERVGSIKFLGALLDEHLLWKEHIRYTETKIAKNIGSIYSHIFTST